MYYKFLLSQIEHFWKIVNFENFHHFYSLTPLHNIFLPLSTQSWPIYRNYAQITAFNLLRFRDDWFYDWQSLISLRIKSPSSETDLCQGKPKQGQGHNVVTDCFFNLINVSNNIHRHWSTSFIYTVNWISLNFNILLGRCKNHQRSN